MADFLLNYMTLAGAVLVFIAAAGVLTFGRNRTGSTAKAALLITVDIMMVYFIFILWMVITSGSSPAVEPIPIAAAIMLA